MAPIKVVKTYLPSKNKINNLKKRKKHRVPLESLKSDANINIQPKPGRSNPIKLVKKSSPVRLSVKKSRVGLSVGLGPQICPPLFNSSSELSSIDVCLDTTFDRLLQKHKDEGPQTLWANPHNKENVAISVIELTRSTAKSQDALDSKNEEESIVSPPTSSTIRYTRSTSLQAAKCRPQRTINKHKPRSDSSNLGSNDVSPLTPSFLSINQENRTPGRSINEDIARNSVMRTPCETSSVVTVGDFKNTKSTSDIPKELHTSIHHHSELKHDESRVNVDMHNSLYDSKSRPSLLNSVAQQAHFNSSVPSDAENLQESPVILKSNILRRRRVELRSNMQLKHNTVSDISEELNSTVESPINAFRSRYILRNNPQKQVTHRVCTKKKQKGCVTVNLSDSCNSASIDLSKGLNSLSLIDGKDDDLQKILIDDSHCTSSDALKCLSNVSINNSGEPQQLQSTPMALINVQRKNCDDFSPITAVDPVISPPFSGFDEGCMSNTKAEFNKLASCLRDVENVSVAALDINHISINASADMFPSIDNVEDSYQSNTSPSLIEGNEEKSGLIQSVSNGNKNSECPMNASCIGAQHSFVETEPLDKASINSSRDITTSFESAKDQSDPAVTSQGTCDKELTGHCHLNTDNILKMRCKTTLISCDRFYSSSMSQSSISCSSMSDASLDDVSFNRPVDRYSLRSRKIAKNSFVESLEPIGENDSSDAEENICLDTQEYVKHAVSVSSNIPGLADSLQEPGCLARTPGLPHPSHNLSRECVVLLPRISVHRLPRQSILLPPSIDLTQQCPMLHPSIDLTQQPAMLPPSIDLTQQSPMLPPSIDLTQQPPMLPPSIDLTQQSSMLPPSIDLTQQSAMLPPCNNLTRQSAMLPPADICRPSSTSYHTRNNSSCPSTSLSRPDGTKNLSRHPPSVGVSRASVMSPRASVSHSRHSIISRRYSHQVVPGKMLKEPKPESLLFRDLHRIDCNDATNNSFASLKECDSTLEVDISEAPAEVITARDVVLQKCEQKHPVPFSDVYCDKFLRNCKKIGEGLYGEVFKWNDGTSSSVIKIIPIDGEQLVNGERQKKFDEILSEIVITQELSSLRNGTQCRTSGFVRVIRNCCVQGRYPQQLIDLWEDFAEDPGTENDCPTMFTDTQLYIILELADGGRDLEKFEFNNANQALSVFMQTSYALAVAEASIQFEHRDLHWGNVLIAGTNQKCDTYVVDGDQHTVETNGIQVSIIDFTLSRMTYEGCCIFNDLSLDPSLFMSEGDYQFDIYRKMKEECRNEWSEFKPYNNILWLHYLIKKCIDGVHYKRKTTKTHRIGLTTLKLLETSLLEFKSAADFVSSCPF